MRPCRISYPPTRSPVASTAALRRVSLSASNSVRTGSQPRPSPRRAPRRGGLDAVPVDDGAPQHLEAAADPQDHRRIGRDTPRVERVEEATAAERSQVGDGRPGAGQHDEVGSPQLVGPRHPADVHAGFGHQRVEVREVGQARQQQYGHVEQVRCRRRGRRRRGPRQRVLGVELEPLEEGQHAERRDTRAGLELVRTVAQQGGITPEPVDDEAADRPSQLLGEDGDGAEEMGEHPATLDVAHDDGGQAGPHGQAQVHDVVLQQVDLGRAAGALADHDVVPGAQRRQRTVDDVHQGLLGGLVRGRLLQTGGAAQHDHLGGPLPRRLEQDRVHGHLGLGAGRDGLEPLGPADLTSLAGDHGIERHVLALEGRHGHALPGQDAAESGHHGALAGIGGGPADHQCPVHGCRSIGHRPHRPKEALDRPPVGTQMCAHLRSLVREAHRTDRAVCVDARARAVAGGQPGRQPSPHLTFGAFARTPKATTREVTRWRSPRT